MLLPLLPSVLHVHREAVVVLKKNTYNTNFFLSCMFYIQGVYFALAQGTTGKG